MDVCMCQVDTPQMTEAHIASSRQHFACRGFFTHQWMTTMKQRSLPSLHASSRLFGLSLCCCDWSLLALLPHCYCWYCLVLLLLLLLLLLLPLQYSHLVVISTIVVALEGWYDSSAIDATSIPTTTPAIETQNGQNPLPLLIFYNWRVQMLLVCNKGGFTLPIAQKNTIVILNT